jgi:hypothetical protein
MEQHTLYLAKMFTWQSGKTPDLVLPGYSAIIYKTIVLPGHSAIIKTTIMLSGFQP